MSSLGGDPQFGPEGFECDCTRCVQLRREDKMAQQVRLGISGLLIVGVILILFALAIATSGCASTGLYQMSDQWCAAHPEASSARCPR